MKFMLKCFLLFAILLLCNCSASTEVQRTSEYKCTKVAEQDKLAKFIIDCSAAANPKSDEEGEDLVAQCEKTGIRTLCPVTQVCRTITDEGGFMGQKYFGDWGPCGNNN